ncbi:MAG: site-2 protease family protein [Proteobacteria bacterium]|nr:MAG: site-2 protease family protein [Pseudomonadota bacterium]
MDFSQAADIINKMIALIISLTLHEAGMALVARWQGDKTAQHEGRLTLNPIPHMDPVGTLLFPFIGSLLGGFIFGWAKPLPINPNNFRNRKWGTILTAGSGPFWNLLLCFVSVLIFYAIGEVEAGSPLIAASRLTQAMVTVSAILAIFNLIPVYPLDGGTVLYELLPYDMKQKYDEYVVPYGSMALLALMLFGGFKWIGTVAMVWVAICEAMARAILT